MANIVVKDLKENVELDREAMRTITGGRAAPNLGMAAHPIGHFQNPLSFTTTTMMPVLDPSAVR
jgi:hypothetical protein